MMKKYFHELTDKEFKAAIDKKMRYSDFKQPDWCSYPYALNWIGGCWSLTERKIHCKADCENCDAFKKS